jgi:soluble epoxide hydrolase/lipid-phosphate phosphatase
LKDYVCLVASGKEPMATYCKNSTIKEYNSDHWVMLGKAKELNKDLQEWIESVPV